MRLLFFLVMTTTEGPYRQRAALHTICQVLGFLDDGLWFDVEVARSKLKTGGFIPVLIPLKDTGLSVKCCIC